MRGYHRLGFGLIVVVGLVFALECIRDYWMQRPGNTITRKHVKHLRDRHESIPTYSHVTVPTVRHQFPESTDKEYNIDKDKLSIKERFQKRKIILQKVCMNPASQTMLSSCETEGVKNNLKNASGSHVVYCAIEKAGSTFWKRILQIIDSRNNYTSPLDIPTMMAEYQGGSFDSMARSSWDAIEELTNKYTSIMFVRNPYTRLFSAWLDKFYSVNTIYWDSIGLDIVKSERSILAYKCAYDVTFSELVNYVSKAVLLNYCIDRHFSSNSKHCAACTLDFDYIGKYETLNEDTLFILHSLNLTKHVTLPGDAAERDAIKDGAHWVFYQKHQISECGISFACAMFRVWQRLQSRGVISNQIQFPFKSKLETESLTQKEFETSLRVAHALSKPEDLRNNRHEALAQALRTLPHHVERKLQKAFHLDFQMFDYESDTQHYIQGHIGKYAYFQDCPTNLR